MLFCFRSNVYVKSDNVKSDNILFQLHMQKTRLEEVQVNFCLTWKGCLTPWMVVQGGARGGEGENALGW